MKSLNKVANSWRVLELLELARRAVIYGVSFLLTFFIPVRDGN